MNTALFLCNRTDALPKHWASAGYRTVCVDINCDPGERNGITWLREDVLDFLPPRTEYAFACAMPTCTDLAVSGARWFQDKGLGALADAARLVERCRRILEWTGAPWFLENPVSTLSTYWRKPDFMFDPFEFGGYESGQGDGYTKRTCLWTGGGFVMPERKPILLADDHDRIHRAAPSDDRGDIRSVTPAGFARAVFEANT